MLSSISAQIGLVVAASLAASLGAIIYWAPKLFGGYGGNGPGMGGVLALAGSGALIGLGNLVAAFDGTLDVGVIDSGGDLGGTMIWLSAAGSALLALGALSMFGAVVPALASSETLPDDPWEGHTLEWAAPSPPPVGNFVEPFGVVRSAEPLIDEFEEVE